MPNMMWESIAKWSLLSLSVALAAFLGYLLTVNAVTPSSTQSLANSPIERADAKISGFTFTQSKGDAVEWEIHAKQARLFEREKQALLHDVDVTLYGVKGKELIVSGEEGTFNTATKHFVLANRQSPLVLETGGGYTIYTNHLEWANDKRQISTEDLVRIVGHGIEVTGRGLIGKLGSEEFEVLQDVRVDLIPAS